MAGNGDINPDLCSILSGFFFLNIPLSVESLVSL